MAGTLQRLKEQSMSCYYLGSIPDWK